MVGRIIDSKTKISRKWRIRGKKFLLHKIEFANIVKYSRKHPLSKHMHYYWMSAPFGNPSPESLSSAVQELWHDNLGC